MTSIIGICGVARSGKDTLFKFLQNASSLTFERFAFADELKNDLKNLVDKKMGMNIYSSSTEEKSIIRPLMVAYGEVMRNISNGRCWIDKIKPKVEKSMQNNIIPVITDVRYENELDWINKIENSLTIHIERRGFLGVNEEERRNDPLVKFKSIEKITLQNAPTKDILNKYFSTVAHEITHKYIERRDPRFSHPIRSSR